MAVFPAANFASTHSKKLFFLMLSRKPFLSSSFLSHATFRSVRSACCFIFMLIVLVGCVYYLSFLVRVHVPFVSHLVPRDRDLKKGSMTLVLIRCFADQFNDGRMIRLVKSMQAWENGNWVAYLVNTGTDSVIYAGSAFWEIFAYEERVKLLNIPVNGRYNKWSAGFDVIDAALDVIKDSFSVSFDWLLITNGDNVYEPQFLNFLPSPSEYDGMMTDYWSRWDNNALKQVDFTENNCLEALLFKGHADLGAMVFSLPRFLRENHRFMSFGPVHFQDGLLLEKLRFMGWKFLAVKQCLFSHVHNAYHCTKSGGVWWNSPNSVDEIAHACINYETARLMIDKTFPAPVVRIASSGIKLLELPPDASKIREKALQFQIDTFYKEYFERMKKLRTKICKDLQLNWNFDSKSYLELNTDLYESGLSEQAAVEHFWNKGCFEARSAANLSLSYYDSVISLDLV